MNLRFRGQANTKGLDNAERILSRNLRGGLEGLGKLLVRSAHTRMRKDIGDEQKSLTTEVRGRGLNLSLTAFSTLVQAYIDAFGLPAGTFPPYGPGSRVFKWAARRARNVPNKQVHTTGNPKVISHLSRSKARQQAHFKTAGRKTGVKRIRNVQGRKLTTGEIKQVRDKNIKRLAFVVARNIYERGIKPTYWNVKTLEANKGRIQREIANSLIRGVNEINRT